MRRIDLSSLADLARVLRNPHEGWYHHYFDNGLTNYLPRTDEELVCFPGLDHIYLRLAWSYLEPKQGRFNWALLDDVVCKWTALGFGVAFRVSCKESHDCVFATPEWVKSLGARGEFVPFLGQEPRTWMPDYGDETFLKCLDDFHAAFAERYDAQPWLRYVDIGSYGQWGEGHNWAAGEQDWPVEVLQEHVRLHQRHYRHATLVVPDEFAAQRGDGRGGEFTQWLLNEGIAFRDDSIGVRFHVDNFPADSLSHPEVWQTAWRRRPVIVELQHYHMMREANLDNTWRGRNGSEFGATYLYGALRKMRPTYIGYHGSAATWLEDNPELTADLINQVGYWFLPVSVALPELFGPGASIPITLEWINRGLAPAYRRFNLEVRWREAATGVAHASQHFPSDCTQWLPDSIATESANVKAPPTPGEHTLEVGLFDCTAGKRRPIQLALDRRIETQDGYYPLATGLCRQSPT